MYNSELYLHRCIDSILKQSFKDYELILIDDGSFDLSGRICDEYAERNENIKVIHQINKGVSAARNVGLKNAIGEWVAFIDSDDELVDGGLNLLIGKTSNDVDLVICGYTVHDTIGQIVYEYNHYCEKKLDYIEGLKEMYIPSNLRYQGYLWNKLYRNEVIAKNNLEFNEDIYFNEDRLFITQYICCMDNMHINYSTVPVYKYYEHENSAMDSLKRGFNRKFVTDFDAYILMLNHIKRRTNDMEIINLAYRGIFSSYYSIQRMMWDFSVKDLFLDVKLLLKLMRVTRGNYWKNESRIVYIKRIFKRYLCNY